MLILIFRGPSHVRTRVELFLQERNSKQIGESAWLVDSNETPLAMRDRLRKVSDDASYLVMGAARPVASWQQMKSTIEWIESSERDWAQVEASAAGPNSSQA